MLTLAFAIAALVFAYAALAQEPPPIDGVYRQKGKWFWLKRWLFHLIIFLRKRRASAAAGAASSAETTPAGYGVKSKSNEASMDCVQALPAALAHPKAVDAVYFTGSNDHGCYIVAATARRQKNIVQTLLYLKVPNVGLLELPTLPDTTLTGTGEPRFAAGGLQITPVLQMKEWKVEFSGKLRAADNRLLDVQISLDWIADSKVFDFDTDMNDNAVCEAIAREVWTKEFFNNLKTAHQTHYEQFGIMQGTVNVEGHEQILLCLKGVRDHSYGNLRDWKDLHRYCIQYASLENGMYIAVGLICFPKTMSRLLMGYVMQPDGTKDSVSWTDFEFVNFGDDGHPPETMSFNFTAGSILYRLQCTVVSAPFFYIGDDRDARIHERMCTFIVNGVPGTGISEWEYRNINRHSISSK